jgi:hypothetical protein
LHELLKRNHEVYRNQVIETYGTFYDSQGQRTILDEMTRHPAADETIELGHTGRGPIHPLLPTGRSDGLCSRPTS